MTTWRPLRRGFDRVSGLRDSRAIVLYGTRDLPYDAATDTNGRPITRSVLKVAEIEDSVPITLGQAYPDGDLAGAICVRKRIVVGPVRGCCIVAVYFDNVPYGAGPVRGGLSINQREGEYILAPQASQKVSLTQDTYWVDWVPYRTRATVIITQTVVFGWTVFEGGEAGLMNIIAKNYDKRYTVAGIPCILKPSNITRIRVGYYQATYRFISYGPVAGVPLGSRPGWLLNVPDLGYLEEWYVDNSTSTTVIRKHLATELFTGIGTLLPGLPA